MIRYDPNKLSHETLAVNWFFALEAKPDEMEKLFHESLRHHLTDFLNWLKYQGQAVIAIDEQGIWAAAWTIPDLSGAFFGAWFREEKRGTIAAVKFIRDAYRLAFEKYSVLIGLTKQPALHDLHLALGYDYLGEIPHYFDGQPGRMYVLTKENFYGRSRRRQRHVNHDDKPVLAPVDGALQNGKADDRGDVQPDGGSSPNGGSEREYSVHQRKPRRIAGSVQQELRGVEKSTGGERNGG